MVPGARLPGRDDLRAPAREAGALQLPAEFAGRSYEMRTLFGRVLTQHALKPHAARAMAMPAGEISYVELLRPIGACVAWLTRRGCVSSEVVGITIADEYVHLVASLALLVLGIPQVCLPTRDPASMRLRLAQRIPVDRVIVTDVNNALDGPETLGLTR